jgi:xylan 1,4-beta-xylosidase
VRDLPSKSKGKLSVNLANLPEGTYAMEVYKVGYRSNDAFTSYLDLGKPSQLTRLQVEQIKKQNDGSPVTKEIISVKSGTPLLKELDIRENDVLMLNLVKL